MDTKTYTFTAMVNKRGNEYYAFCPEVATDCDGETLATAVANLRQETESYLKQEPLPGFTKPWLIPAGIEVKPKNNEGKIYIFDVVVHQEDGQYVVFCPEVGTSDYGDTLEYALRMLKAGTKLYLEHAPFPDYSKPQLIDFTVEVGQRELVEVA